MDENYMNKWRSPDFYDIYLSPDTLHENEDRLIVK